MFLVIKAYNHFEDLIVDEDSESLTSESKEIVLLKEIRDGINNLQK
jgi:large-conductance mechanosensitive channel